jgi:UDP:flavonoid glycosyltransferase YjiC (YdhE family)
MATIVVCASGTWGDVLPLAALALALKERGHQVRFAVNGAYHPLIRRTGLDVRPCGRPYGLREAQRPLARRKGWSPVVSEIKKAEAHLFDTPAQFRDLMKACRGADLLIGHSFQYAAMLVHDQRRLPWVSVSLMPGQFAHLDMPVCSQPAPRATLNLLASSTAFTSPDLEVTEYLRVTGFLFFDGNPLSEWQPDERLRSFVQDGGKVLVLSLGCLPGPDAQEAVTKFAHAARKLKRRLVVQPGWARIDVRKLRPSQVHVAGPVPHDWLFSHAEAVIHHGGIGLCARALRQGVPMLLLPQRKDQYFNTHAVLSLKAGAAALLAKMTAGGLTRVLAEKVLTPDCRKAAERVARKLRKEDGLSKACSEVERLLR